jgi:signal recognition particle receptor subunit beta
MSGGTDHVRIIVLGDSGVGKTSFCRMMCVKDVPPEEARKATGEMSLFFLCVVVYLPWNMQVGPLASTFT